jgi:2-phospho-L-lactate guanylyltransferase
VLAAALELPVFVVCDDDEVAAFATDHGAQVLWRPGLGLNGAVADGVATLGGAGYDRVLVAHADLPLAVDIAWLARLGGLTLVPDRHDDGTNVIALPATLGFRFAYGPGSFRHHVAEARRHGTGVRVWREPSLGLDVDLPRDLAEPAVREVLPWLPTSPGSRR